MAYKIQAPAENKQHVEKKIAKTVKKLERYADLIGCSIHINTTHTERGNSTVVWVFGPEACHIKINDIKEAPAGWLSKPFEE